MTPRSRILVVDDDPGIRKSLQENLARQGFDVVVAADGTEAFELFNDTHPDLILSDLAMPSSDGFTLIRNVRTVAATPIVVLSVRGGEADKVRALDLGADDFVVKPFSSPELLARIRAQLRRSGLTEGKQLEFRDLLVDIDRHLVIQGGREIRLTPTEFSLLEYLARRAGRPVSFNEIVAAVWRSGGGTSNDTVRVHVGSLRRKIEPEPSSPSYIVTEPWIGYRFIAEPLR